MLWPRVDMACSGVADVDSLQMNHVCTCKSTLLHDASQDEMLLGGASHISNGSDAQCSHESSRKGVYMAHARDQASGDYQVLL